MLTIDHTRIPHDVLAIALANADRDPDGQVFPWRPMYPLAGSTVYFDGQLWGVVDKDYAGARPCALLVGTGHDGETIAPIGDLRPVTWTAQHEIAYSIAGEPSQAVLDVLAGHQADSPAGGCTGCADIARDGFSRSEHTCSTPRAAAPAGAADDFARGGH